MCASNLFYHCVPPKTRKTLLTGKMREKGKEKWRQEKSKLSFGQGIPRWRRGRQRKMGMEGGRLGLLPLQNTGNPYTHIHTFGFLAGSGLSI